MTGDAPPSARRFFDRPYLLLSLAALQWAGNIVAGRLAVGEILPMQLVVLRWGLVFAALAVLNRRGFAADWPAMRSRPWFLLVLGVTGYTAFTAFFYAAAHFTTGANMSIIQGSFPLFVFSMAWAVRGRPIGPLQGVGIVAALAGVALVAIRGDLAVARNLAFNVGDLFMLGATVGYAIYTIGLEERPRVWSLSFFSAMAGIAFVPSLPLLAVETVVLPFHWPPPPGWAITAYVAIFPSFLAQIFFIRGVELIGPGRAGVFINLNPVFGAAMAVAFLGESVGWYQGVGLVLVMSGIVLAQRR